ncbi:MAG: hypothetical protein Q7U20_07860 [Caulobacter sp.]|nr:hypothetical protein [Caulobacter sp.]
MTRQSPKSIPIRRQGAAAAGGVSQASLADARGEFGTKEALFETSAQSNAKFLAPKRRKRQNTNIAAGNYIDDAITARLSILDQFVLDNPGVSISSLVVELFPELTAGVDGRHVPTKAPALWLSDRDPDDKPPDFIRRHYAPWLGKGLRRADLRQLDPSLYDALRQHLLKHEMPADIDLPTIQEFNDRWVAKVAEGDEPLPDGALARSRLRSAMHVRSAKAEKS